MVASSDELKRLGFVNTYASTAVSLSSSMYTTARSYVPGFADPYIRTVEEKTTSISMPYVNWAQDTASGVLKSVDGQLDNTYNTVSGGANFSRDLHTKNMETFTAAKEEYFKWVENSVNSLKAKLNPYPYAETACLKLKQALDQAVTMADPDLAIDQVHDAWAKFASIGVVAKALDVVEPVTSKATVQYTKVHDSVVKMPVYKKTYQTVTGTVSAVHESFLYKKAKDLLYPVVAPVADPVYDNFATSTYLAQLNKHLTPVMA
jgi:hypothetical protein